jgi:hypothetical protein
MKNSGGSRYPRSLIIICVTLATFASLPLLSRARTTSTSVNIVNNSSREVRNVYLSHVDADDWSADVLGDGTILAGQSSSLNNLACDQGQVKVIAEDQDGCFLSTVVSCGDSASWTITNDTARDCGGN